VAPVTDRDADLRARIVADPEDDAPRLDYARVLLERGDPRGELIRVQCALAAPAADDEQRRAWADRERALLRAHEEEWSEAFRAHDATVVFRRGFPHTFIGAGAAFLASRQLFATEPLRTLVLIGDAKPTIREIAAAPELARLTSLVLKGGHRLTSKRTWALGDEGFAALATSPHLTGLGSLELGFNGIGPDGARALAGAAFLPRLTELIVRENALGAAGLAALARPPRLARLHRLWLDDCAPGDEGAAALAVAGMSALESLRVSADAPGPRLGAQGAMALAGANGLPALRRLDLTGNHLGDSGAIAIARSAHLPRLTDLVLAGNLVGDAGASAFAAATERGGLLTLDLSQNQIGAAGASALAASRELASLRSLDLCGNRLGVDGVTALAEGTGLPALQGLGASRNGIYTDEIETWTDWDGTPTGSGPREESHAALKARFGAKPHWHIT
jgi:uncharacterized protein (TIGR02996 family)